jgi:hypothetical protein
MLTASHKAPTLTARQTSPIIYRLRAKLTFAFLNATAHAPNPRNHAINPEANGKANRWQGYVARDGFGITRIKNHTSDTSPATGNIHFNHPYFLLPPLCLPALEQSGWSCFLLDNRIFTSPNFSLFSKKVKCQLDLAGQYKYTRALLISQHKSALK